MSPNDARTGLQKPWRPMQAPQRSGPAPGTMQGQLELPFVDLPTVANSPRTTGSDPRPVAVPDVVDDPRHEKASGVVQLPSNVRWSGPPTTYDLDDPIDRARVYEQVLGEGTDDDVRHFIGVDVLEKLWHTIVVPTRVREAWARWFRRHRVATLRAERARSGQDPDAAPQPRRAGQSLVAGDQLAAEVLRQRHVHGVVGAHVRTQLERAPQEVDGRVSGDIERSEVGDR